jgi:hypothetical protein
MLGDYISSGVYRNGKITLGSLKSYVTNGLAGSGTVTSVALTAPDIFTVTGSGGTTAVSLVVAPTDPGADRLVFWDDSASKWVYLTPGAGVLITAATIALDINGLTADGTPDGSVDYVVTYDASAGALKKVLLEDLPGGSGGGDVATDTIWDAKGDLAVGTGANTAQKLTIGANDTILVADSAQTTGTKWLAITGFETTLEGVLDLQDMQGAVTDAQVPNTITIDLATLASTVTVIDSTDSTSYVLIADSATGSLPVKTDAGLTYDASTGQLSATSLRTAGSGVGTIELGDSDDSHSVFLKAAATTTSEYSVVFPPAGFTGFAQMTLSGSDASITQFTGGAGLLGIDGSNVPVHVNTEAEFETAIGGVDVVTVTTDDITSANLRTALSDESGTGAAVFAGGDIGAATATTPSSGDNDTSVATTAFVQIELGTLGNIDDTAFASSWNGVTTDAATKNAIYDWGHTFDTDDDGLPNVIDSTFTFSGMSITGDGDGAITFLGTGDGADEDLTINLDDTANNAIITTSTGLTNITLTAINLTVPAAVYDATAWNGNNTTPTRDDVRDKIELLNVGTIGITIDGGGSAITTGLKGFIEIPYACTITRVTMLADQSGSAVVDVWKDTYANYPPTDADTITASAVPTISAATKSQDATLTGWTTSVSAGDIIGFNVDSASTITRLTITLKTTR